jgi:hypothetical protein
MDPEIKRQLEEIHALSRDNHRMLRAIRRDQWLSFVGKIVFWVILLALPLYLYQQYIQPLVAQFQTTTGMITSGPFGIPTTADLQKLINLYKAGK